MLKKGSFITSGQTAGQGLPHIRLNDRNRLVETKRCDDKKIANKTFLSFHLKKKGEKSFSLFLYVKNVKIIWNGESWRSEL